MKVLKFTLSGKTAFFKKPDVNTYYYFTYGNIHKVALMGILGAILGYSGYNQQKNNQKTLFPEFYEKLKATKLGIVPRNNKGYISKKVQIFNNSVGYASKEQGGNLIIKEQWLEDPKWDIYILIEGEVENELADKVMKRKFKYIPYLGKNDHIANIVDSKIIDNIEPIATANKVDSLFLKDCFELQPFEDDPFDVNIDYTPIYKYQEMLPVTLEETTNKYEVKPFIYTNSPLEPIKNSLVYKCDNNIIFFF
ncbi:CRISPR-associated protein, Cas5h family [Natronincola peptidivorans]|uniref:CRISPR-associated protein, Cas5h family n=1 Tax=Natronincola peptidivorans TaxID=426128 RepID=A0A1I0DCX6_9FIRM|nr:type I-B CRISPR-associated protein Cas5b [Natronincola peptidivorans]SET30183.1 CRISPR-associated protein, Cas5h family [Natronincola peptidivorans]